MGRRGLTCVSFLLETWGCGLCRDWRGCFPGDCRRTRFSLRVLIEFSGWTCFYEWFLSGLTGAVCVNQLGELGGVHVRHRKARALTNDLILVLTIGATLCFKLRYGIPFCMMTIVDLVMCNVLIGFFHYPVHLFKRRARGIIMTPTSNGVMIIRRIRRGRCFRSHHVVMSVFVDLIGMRTG